MRRSSRGSRTARYVVIAGLAALAGGCTWVKLTEPGNGVRVGTVAQAASCKKLGATHAKTSTRIAFFSRSPQKIDTELEALARNEAAEMGGDTIVAQGPASSEGRRSFDVFRCAGS
jgi:Domain of unknown function (DUF4156)